MEIANQSLKFFERSLRAIIASMGLAVYVAAPSAPSYPIPNQTHESAYSSLRAASLVKQPKPLSKSAIAHLISSVPEAISEIGDGVYLYGQSQMPFEIGYEYLVFEVNGDEIIGASYLPYSEFVCFAGRLEGNHISVYTVSPNQPELTTQLNSMELQPILAVRTDVLIGVGGTADVIAFPPINLADYHAITGVSQLDAQILNHCQQTYQTGRGTQV